MVNVVFIVEGGVGLGGLMLSRLGDFLVSGFWAIIGVPGVACFKAWI